MTILFKVNVFLIMFCMCVVVCNGTSKCLFKHAPWGHAFFHVSLRLYHHYSKLPEFIYHHPLSDSTVA